MAIAATAMGMCRVQLCPPDAGGVVLVGLALWVFGAPAFGPAGLVGADLSAADEAPALGSGFSLSPLLLFLSPF